MRSIYLMNEEEKKDFLVDRIRKLEKQKNDLNEVGRSLIGKENEIYIVERALDSFNYQKLLNEANQKLDKYKARYGTYEVK